MGAVASSGEPTPERTEIIDNVRLQEIQCLKNHYETEIRMLQATHNKEKWALKQENQKLRSDIRVQMIINNKLRRNNVAMREVGAALQTELLQVKTAVKKLQEYKDIGKIEIRRRREKRIRMERAREIRSIERFCNVI